jgi:hypothetical protein
MTRQPLDSFVQWHAHTTAHARAHRLYPPVPVNSKAAVNDDVLPNGAFIPAGVRLTRTRVTARAHTSTKIESWWWW